jgi:hypothetical protein
MSGIDHEFTKNIICPQCGHKIKDTLEYEGGEEIECDCGAIYIVYQNIEITYTTELVQSGGGD